MFPDQFCLCYFSFEYPTRNFELFHWFWFPRFICLCKNRCLWCLSCNEKRLQFVFLKKTRTLGKINNQGTFFKPRFKLWSVASLSVLINFFNKMFFLKFLSNVKTHFSGCYRKSESGIWIFQILLSHFLDPKFLAIFSILIRFEIRKHYWIIN